ncbi:hypothetical protein KHC23_02145 [Ancylobacter dichloromethanicus]|uniref:Uncharacterized protein n=1 Tax=Ancylobacter dichloromethanicus TaxID=518825 RepID=A0A9W6N1H4_9HYPH|nr:hypothetical protein [Ancylobacter dichloromethanicus]MBS7552461.1 hypothetical protein [Ancylobacter dichloromethanicus]GLK74203.1 hypothetical protein GCM10017643_43210 [Ancylobacter dichloromethanicus]
MAPTPAFTIATLVTDPSLYEQMKASFREKGFADDCEFLTVDNTGSRQTDAYAGLNRLLNQASAPLVILCHQDVVLFGDGRTELEARLRELSELDPCWALAGNGGGSGFDRLHIRITDKFGDNQRRNGPFPVRVHSLDENFIVVRAEARIGLSRNLTGFHMYGTDICLVADILGWNAYVIDYHLQHLGEARMGPAFAASLDQFRRKWNHALRERYLQSTCTRVLVTGAGQPDLVKKLRLRTRSAFFGLRRRIGTLIAK